MRRFSKLKKRIEGLFAPNLNLCVYCNVYQRPCYYGGTSDIPRLWLTLNKEIIFDFGKDFENMRIIDAESDRWYGSEGRPYFWSDITDINNLIQKYIETPVNLLFDKVFEKDYFGITDILKAADRRIGKNRLLVLRQNSQNQAVKKIVDARTS